MTLIDSMDILAIIIASFIVLSLISTLISTGYLLITTPFREKENKGNLKPRILVTNIGGLANPGIGLMLQSLVTNFDADYYYSKWTICRGYEKYGLRGTWNFTGFDLAVNLGGDAFTIYQGRWQFIRYCFRLMLLLASRQPYALLGQTFCDYGFLNPVAQFFLRRAKLVTVRGTRSKNLLDRWHIFCFETGDLVWSLTAKQLPKIQPRDGSYHSTVWSLIHHYPFTLKSFDERNWKFDEFKKPINVDEKRKRSQLNFLILKNLVMRKRVHLESFSGELRESEYLAIHHPRYFEAWNLIQSLSPLPCKVLEVGTLFGHISIGLKQQGYEVESSDLEEEADKYHNNLGRFGIKEYVCDISQEHLPVSNNFYDMVLFLEVLEHLNPLSMQHIFQELSRILKPEGFLLVSTPNYFNLGARIRKLLGRKDLCLEHTREYCLDEVKDIVMGKNIFQASGGIPYLSQTTNLKVVKSWYSLTIDRLKTGGVKLRVARLMLLPLKILHKRFRSSFYIVAVKI